jgi:hypothetical protein
LEYATTTETMRKKYDEGVLRSRSEFTAAWKYPMKNRDKEI